MASEYLLQTAPNVAGSLLSLPRFVRFREKTAAVCEVHGRKEGRHALRCYGLAGRNFSPLAAQQRPTTSPRARVLMIGREAGALYQLLPSGARGPCLCPAAPNVGRERGRLLLRIAAGHLSGRVLVPEREAASRSGRRRRPGRRPRGVRSSDVPLDGAPTRPASTC